MQLYILIELNCNVTSCQIRVDSDRSFAILVECAKFFLFRMEGKGDLSNSCGFRQ